jgi:hypothetical protein
MQDAKGAHEAGQQSDRGTARPQSGGSQPDCRLVAWSNTYTSPKRARLSDCRLTAFSNTYSTSYIRSPARPPN